ncbi:hypothetical protein B484DRAFT_442839 [Ochromonadaceae sp. CCMP2298]|nr:hypothetical protein B484DRAFT_442839 [Ochromonadaceae sp. CCMP2298]
MLVLLLLIAALGLASGARMPDAMLVAKAAPEKEECGISSVCSALKKIKGDLRFDTFARGLVTATTSLNLVNGAAFLLHPETARKLAFGLVRTYCRNAILPLGALTATMVAVPLSAPQRLEALKGIAAPLGVTLALVGANAKGWCGTRSCPASASGKKVVKK